MREKYGHCYTTGQSYTNRHPPQLNSRSGEIQTWTVELLLLDFEYWPLTHVIWLLALYTTINDSHGSNTRLVGNEIVKKRRDGFRPNSIKIHDENGDLPSYKENILKRWSEYYQDLLNKAFQRNIIEDNIPMELIKVAGKNTPNCFNGVEVLPELWRAEVLIPI